MSSAMCCPLTPNDGDDGPTFYTEKVRRAAKDHKCCECDGTIKRGDQYEDVSGCWDGHFSVYRTCLVCVEIRKHFACGNGWYYEQLRADLDQNFIPNMRAGGPCMKGLSVAARNALFERKRASLGLTRRVPT